MASGLEADVEPWCASADRISAAKVRCKLNLLTENVS